LDRFAPSASGAITEASSTTTVNDRVSISRLYGGSPRRWGYFAR
jgi:hypothetical protein